MAAHGDDGRRKAATGRFTSALDKGGLAVMGEDAHKTWLDFLQQERSRVSDDFMDGVEDLPLQQREGNERDQVPVGCRISDAERRKRQDAVDFARASLGLSGFQVSEEQESLAQRYVDGEIDAEEFLKAPITSPQQKN